MQNNTIRNVTGHYIYTTKTKYLDIVLLSLLTPVGNFGNVLMLLAICINATLRKLQNVFVVNLAVVDLLITSFILPLPLIATITGEFPVQGVWFQIAGYIISATCWLSILSITFIALNMYVFICRHNTYSKYFNKCTVVIIIFLSWTWCIFAISPQVLGWSRIDFVPYAALCAFIPEESDTYLWPLIATVVVFPACATTYCYFQIYKMVKQSKKELTKFQSTVQLSHLTHRERNLMASFVVFSLFILFWAPCASLVVVHSFGIST